MGSFIFQLLFAHILVNNPGRKTCDISNESLFFKHSESANVEIIKNKLFEKNKRKRYHSNPCRPLALLSMGNISADCSQMDQEITTKLGGH